MDNFNYYLDHFFLIYLLKFGISPERHCCIMLRSLTNDARPSWFKYRVSHLLALWPGPTHLTNQKPYFPCLRKIGLLTVRINIYLLFILHIIMYIIYIFCIGKAYRNHYINAIIICSWALPIFRNLSFVFLL